MSGFIQIHRTLLDWEWYSDINTKTLFIHCLLMANWKDNKWQGEDLKRGMFATSVKSLSKETGLSDKMVRLSLDKLKRTNELAIKTTNKYTVLTIVKYDTYQQNDTSDGKQKDNQKDKRRATIEESNNILLFTPEQVEPILLPKKESVNWDALREQFNEITGKHTKVINKETKKQILERLQDGYTKRDIIDAITNCFNDPFHIESGHKYLTLEFISRSVKMDNFVSRKAHTPKPQSKDDKL